MLTRERGLGGEDASSSPPISTKNGAYAAPGRAARSRIAFCPLRLKSLWNSTGTVTPLYSNTSPQNRLLGFTSHVALREAKIVALLSASANLRITKSSSWRGEEAISISPFSPNRDFTRRCRAR